MINNPDEKLIAHSEDSEVRYYEDGSFAVDNYDTEVSFDDEVTLSGKYTRTKDGSIIGIPFKSHRPGKGCDKIILTTGPATFRRTPWGKNVKLTIILPRDAATEKNFRSQFNEAFVAIRESNINLTQAE